MTNKRYEKNLHEAVILSEVPRKVNVGDIKRYTTDREVFDALQGIRDDYSRPFSKMTRALSSLVGLGNGFTPYFLVLNFKPENPQHSSFITSGSSGDLEGRSFGEDLSLKDRLKLGHNSGPLVLNNNGRIVYSGVQFADGVGKRLERNDIDGAGIRLSDILNGICVYTMEGTGSINRYRAGKVTFSTDPERISEVNEHILPEVREVMFGNEHPIDLANSRQEGVYPFFNLVQSA